MNGFLVILAILFLVTILAAFCLLVRWAAADAIERGKSPWLVSLAVVLFFPWGLLAWLVFRPESTKRPPFRLDDYRMD